MMDQLLQRWVQLEPERCQNHALHYSVLIRGEWSRLFYVINHPEAVVQREAFLQVAVQEAVEAHHWRWVKEFGNSNVVCVYRPEIPLGTSSRAFVSRKDGSLAKTLLDAYLQALEAN